MSASLGVVSVLEILDAWPYDPDYFVYAIIAFSFLGALGLFRLYQRIVGAPRCPVCGERWEAFEEKDERMLFIARRCPGCELRIQDQDRHSGRSEDQRMPIVTAAQVAEQLDTAGSTCCPSPWPSPPASGALHGFTGVRVSTWRSIRSLSSPSWAAWASTTC